MLALTIVSFRLDRNGARVVFRGGHVLEYRRQVEPAPELPGHTITTTGVALPSEPPPSLRLVGSEGRAA